MLVAVTFIMLHVWRGVLDSVGNAILVVDQYAAVAAFEAEARSVSVKRPRICPYLWHTMKLSRNDKDQLVITLEGRVDPNAVQRLLDKLEFMELATGTKEVSEQSAERIAEEIKSSWWAKYEKIYRVEGRR